MIDYGLKADHDEERRIDAAMAARAGREPARPRESILSGHLADRFIAETPANSPLTITTGRGIAVTLRRRLQRTTPGHVHLTPTGAVVVSARGQHFAHQGRTPERHIVLRAGWTRAALSRAIHRLLYTVGTADILSARREAVYQVWEPHMRDDRVPALEAAGLAAGYNVMYEDMTEADCDYWLGVAAVTFTPAPGTRCAMPDCDRPAVTTDHDTQPVCAPCFAGRR